MDNMAKVKNNISQITGKLENDRHLALLALTLKQDDTEEKLNAGCPSSEDLALLIEKKTSENFSQSDLLQHISHCTNCYEEWLALSIELSKSPKKSSRLTHIRYIFSNTRNLTAAGSAVAIAASITIFLAIPPEDINNAEIYKAPVQRSENLQVQEEIFLEDAIPPTPTMKNKALSSPSPKPRVEFAEQKGDSINKELGSLENEQFHQTASPNLAKKEIRKENETVVSGGLSLTDPSFNHFSTQIQSFCNDVNAEMKHVILLQEYGQELLANRAEFELNKIEIIEQLIQQLGLDINKIELCQELQHILSSTP